MISHAYLFTAPRGVSAAARGGSWIAERTVQVPSGNLKVLAVTDKERFPAVPDVPTVMESGVVPNYDVTSWYGVFGPPGMALSVVAKLNKTLNEIIADEKVRDHLVSAGVVVKGSTAEEFGAAPDGRIRAVERCPRSSWHRATVDESALGAET